VRTLSGIPDARLHDLRHSFATFAVESGAPLYHVGRALGHSKTTSTERYAHPSDAGARAVASEVAARFVTASAPANGATSVGDGGPKPSELAAPPTPAIPALRTPARE
jgi:Phage integrase family